MASRVRPRILAFGVGIALAIALGPLEAVADSTITVPVPDAVSNEAKNLVLTLTVPTELERITKPSVDEPKRVKRTAYRKYFDLEPFPRVAKREDSGIVADVAQKVVRTDALKKILSKRNVESSYELARSIFHVIDEIFAQPADELSQRGLTRGDLDGLLAVMDRYPKELRIMQVGAKQRDDLVKLAKRLSFTDGEVKVVKVETDDIGATVIHLTLAGTGDRYKPKYLSKIEKEREIAAEKARESEVQEAAPQVGGPKVPGAEGDLNFVEGPPGAPNGAQGGPPPGP